MKKLCILAVIVFGMSICCSLTTLAQNSDESPASTDDASKEKEPSREATPDLDVKLKIGAEFSSVSSGNDTANADSSENIFSQQYFFMTLSAKWALTDRFDIVPEVCFEKLNYEESSPDTNIPEIVKDASTIAGKFDLFYHSAEKLDRLYIRASPYFSYVYDQTANNDVIFDSFIGAGIRRNDKGAKYRGSYFEIGYGYSDRFSYRHRFKANLRLAYTLNKKLRPFIEVNLDADLRSGPDDIRVMYGVEIPASNIWESISTAISGKSPENAG